MRPTRLELEGFTAFRDRVEVDLADADLVAFTGPTGSGKSSLVDAMIFALYGSVPRLDRRAVAPVISLGRVEARVALDFTVGGVGYRAVRVVRRTKQGASTKEARLEQLDDGGRGGGAGGGAGGQGVVLAGNEKELTAQVEALLGLDFDHFTKSVVLPQGEFARFLHDTGADRQGLLVKLLDLGLYDRMGSLARARQKQAAQQAELAGALLAKLADATPESRATAASRVDELTVLRTEAEAVVPEVARLREVVATARREGSGAAERAATLAAIEPPDEPADRRDALAEARSALARCQAAEQQAATAADLADDARRALPDRGRLEAAASAHAEQAGHLEQVARGRSALTDAATALAAAATELARAEATHADATTALERARWEHRAHDLAGSLAVGEPCPVCRQAVGSLPTLDGAVTVDQARAAEERSAAELRRARAAHTDAERQHFRVEEKLASIAEQLERLAPALAQHGDPRQVEEALRAVTDAEAAHARAVGLDRNARHATIAARQALDALVAADQDDRRRFDRARDTVAALGPPEPARNDLAEDWAALGTWAVDRLVVERAAATTAERLAGEAAADQQRLAGGLTARCASAGVALDGEEATAALARSSARAEADLARLDTALAEAAQHRDEVAEHTAAAEAAGALARHLSAGGFEKWVLDEALGLLVEGATTTLCELSNGAFSLALDERSSNFMVVDHRNADERRSARTLSGGETFLASLALALALADQIALLASRGSARLESIFLDEGFGTLDAETLDTVAAAIEELGARGRMVGVISHVVELAERMPVRFEVTKGPGTATVTRVGA